MSGEDPIGRPDGPDRVIREDLDDIIGVCTDAMRKLSGSSLLLTGGSGFVGRYLVESVIRFNEISGAAPCVVTLPSRSPELLVSRYRRQVDAKEVVVVDWTGLRASDLDGLRWDYVVHGAATADPVPTKPGGVVVWPNPPSPQPHTVPLSLMTMLWSPPAAITAAKAGTAGKNKALARSATMNTSSLPGCRL